MRKFLFLALSVLLVSCVFDADVKPGLSVIEESHDRVVFLHSPTCGYSRSAQEYLQNNYRAPVYYVNIDKQYNVDWVKAAQYDYELKKTWGDSIRTPIICFGENYVMGWGYDQRILLDKYIQKYLIEE